MVTEPGTKPKQSVRNYSDIIPNDNVLEVLLLPWCECLHFGLVDNDHIDRWKAVSCSSTEVVSLYPQMVSAFQFYQNKNIIHQWLMSSLVCLHSLSSFIIVTPCKSTWWMMRRNFTWSKPIGFLAEGSIYSVLAIRKNCIARLETEIKTDSICGNRSSPDTGVREHPRWGRCH